MTARLQTEPIPQGRARARPSSFLAMPSSDRMPHMSTATQNYLLADLSAVEPTRCPCGWARRAFAVPENTTATMHLVDILEDSRATITGK